MSLTIFNDDEFQALEHRAANQLGEATLMERAGAAAAALIESRLPSDAKVSILAGPGNNGGDAIALACELKEKIATLCSFCLLVVVRRLRLP